MKGDIHFQKSENIPFPIDPSLEAALTPPPASISYAKSLRNINSSGGGVLPKIPPAGECHIINDPGSLPADILAGLRVLKEAPAPIITRPDVWEGIVSDALMLAAAGWARHALDLGWSPLDIFGVGERDDWDFQGLAVWLAGMRLVSVDEVQAIATDDIGKVRYFIRGGMRHGTHPTVTPVALWEFGRR
ncbi:hypothetical protein E2E30_08885 [Sphingomonas sp. AAP5]|nr:hypothetical protein E2E30_08885 [Sphingomonas sp. AAP5]